MELGVVYHVLSTTAVPGRLLYQYFGNRTPVRYTRSLHQRKYDRYLLTGYYGYMVAREYYEESSFGVENGILRGIRELRIYVVWVRNILVIVLRGQLL